MQNEKYNCKICDTEFNEDSKLHRHLRKHSISVADYYRSHYPRHDKLTGDLIEFKSKEYYFSTDFNNKINLKKFLEQNKEAGREYLVEYLCRRKAEKGILYSPSQFEAKTLKFPSVKYIENYYGQGAYNEISAKSGLKTRFDYGQILEYDLDKKIEFFADTREKKLLDLPTKEIKKLDVGDYSIEDSNIFIEKKSLVDFCGTFSKGYERFIREFQRAKDSNSYVIILVEESFNNISSIAYLPHTQYIKATAEFLFHKARELCSLFPLNCQIVCASNKKHAAEVAEKIFRLKNDVKTVDLQFYIDKNLL